MFFGLSNGYLLLIVVTLAIGGLATWYVNSQLKKYTRVPISNGLTGAEAARRMLAYYGVTTWRCTVAGRARTSSTRARTR